MSQNAQNPSPANANPVEKTDKPNQTKNDPAKPSNLRRIAVLLVGAALVALYVFAGDRLGRRFTTTVERLGEVFRTEPLVAASLVAALAAMVLVPVAFAALSERPFFQARRGRSVRKPEFASVVCAMALCMGVPAIFAALVVKSRYFDANRYEFDPNRVSSVLDQGRGFRSLREADDAVRDEMKRLADERQALARAVEEIDKEVLKLRALAAQSAPVARAVNPVLERLAVARRAVGIDAPMQLLDEQGLPEALPGPPPGPVVVLGGTPGIATAAAPGPAASAAAPAGTGFGLAPAEWAAEIALVPEPLRPLAEMLPLENLPPGWEVGEMGGRRLETFDKDNLYEKIDGRAESFVQYNVKGMAYTNYHPVGDDANEIQIYIFELGSSLDAFGKYGTEKPDGVETLPIGKEGYSTAGSTLFYNGRYYTQIVSTVDQPEFAEFARHLADRVAAAQDRAARGEPIREAPAATAPATTVAAAPSATATAPAATPATAPAAELSPEALLEILPPEPNKARAQFIAEDVFGYDFLTRVFLADYTDDGVTFQGFLRPYASADEAAAVLAKYRQQVAEDGGTVRDVELGEPGAEGGPALVVGENVGLFDVLFLRDNVLGGVNGATELEPAREFAEKLLRSLPPNIPEIRGE